MTGQIISGDRAVSMDEIVERAARAATGLARLGVGDADTIALLLRNDMPYFEASFAAAALGAYPVPINWHYTGEEAGYILADSGAKVLIVHADLLPAVEADIPPGVEVLVVPTPPEIQAAYDLPAGSSPVPGGRSEWGLWLEDFTQWESPPPNLRGSMIYTSGTTGRPKGVRRQPMTEAQVVGLTELTARVFGIQPGIRTVITGPMYHSAPNFFALQSALAGGTLVLQPRFDAVELLTLIERHRIDTLHMVPTMFVRMLKLPQPERTRHDLSSLRWVVHAAAPCPPQVKRGMIEWLGPVVAEYYGATESGAVVACTSEEWLAHPGTVGRPVDGARVRIYDDAGRPLPTGQVGEVYMRLDAIPDFTYHGKDAQRREIERDGLITCGDVGYLDDEGYLYLCDRKRDLVISGGVNIYPAEIEAVLIGLPGVQDCAVFGIPDDEFGESLAAIIAPMDGETPSAAEIRAGLSEHLAGYKIPRHIEFRGDLPREDSGKIFKRKLREPFWRDAGRSI
ncbi:MAG: AMP-binding protein [SAR324 cluster bacterium]|nr:AMP-binding protein [SAR324 cluster bacterium]